LANHLLLPADAEAPARARRWVQERLRAIGRPELVDAAMLGVSELVTNALLHAGGGIAVRILDTNGRLRVEVYDESPVTPELPPVAGLEARTNPSTVGRGLQILDSVSIAWGVYDEETGKCVWFQPAAVGLPVRSGVGPMMVNAPIPVAADAGQHVFVQLLQMPVVLFAHYRTRLHDLRRELTLIALDDGHSSPQAEAQVVQAARQHDHHLHHIDMIGHIDEAIAVGLDRIDVRVAIPRVVLPELELMRDALRALNDRAASRRLLTLAPGPQERAIWEWYFSELLGQARGAPPHPWTGGFHVTDRDPLAD
jgi:anti-sigma regulatory factor (Ser/Thr protein kinase)